jgi:hypothetical protein
MSPATRAGTIALFLINALYHSLWNNAISCYSPHNNEYDYKEDLRRPPTAFIPLMADSVPG